MIGAAAPLHNESGVDIYSHVSGILFLSPLLYLRADSSSLTPFMRRIVDNVGSMHRLFNCGASGAAQNAQSHRSIPNYHNGGHLHEHDHIRNCAYSCDNGLCSSLLHWRDILLPRVFASALSRMAHCLFGWRFHNIEVGRRATLFQHLFSATPVDDVVCMLQLLLHNGADLPPHVVNKGKWKAVKESVRKIGGTFTVLGYGLSFVRWLVVGYCSACMGVVTGVYRYVRNLLYSVIGASSCNVRTSDSGSSADRGRLAASLAALHCPLTMVVGSDDCLVSAEGVRALVRSINTTDSHGNKGISGGTASQSDITLHELPQYEHMDTLWANQAHSKVHRDIVLWALQ